MVPPAPNPSPAHQSWFQTHLPKPWPNLKRRGAYVWHLTVTAGTGPSLKTSGLGTKGWVVGPLAGRWVVAQTDLRAYMDGPSQIVRLSLMYPRNEAGLSQGGGARVG